MKLKNFRTNLNLTTGIIRRWITALVTRSDKYLKFILRYFQTSEAIFLLFFAGIVGVGAGFGAVIFRLMIAFFQNLIFNQGQHILSFLGSYYVIIIMAIGGIVVGLLVHFFARETKGPAYRKSCWQSQPVEVKSDPEWRP
jgi:H+/Cl- antiporter ClcA